MEERKSRLMAGRADWPGPLENWISTAKSAGEIAVPGSLEEKKDLVWKIFDSNLVLDCKKPPWFLRESVAVTVKPVSNWWSGAHSRT
jgi:hypothetical protein